MAGIASHRALMTYDPATNVPLKRWIALRVKTAIWCYWRKIRDRHEEYQPETWWSEVYTLDEEQTGLLVDQATWKLLLHKYVDKWPYDVVGREYGWSTAEAKRQVKGAVHRFVTAYKNTLDEDSRLIVEHYGVEALVLLERIRGR